MFPDCSSTRVAVLLAALALPAALTLQAQQSSAATASLPAANSSGPASAVPITLDEAIRRAQLNEPNFRTAVGDARLAALDRSIARTALLPTVTAHNQALYTQPNGSSNQAGQTGSQPSPKFIANNAIHEYATQAVINETLNFAQLADARRIAAIAAQAAALQEVARRGLVTTVVGLYYAAAAADQKLALADRALREADSFGELTRQLENGREVAHADVLKALLQSQQRQRDLEDARLAQDKSRLDLAVLLFPDPLTAYQLADDLAQTPPMPPADTVEAAARLNNPDLQAALAAVRAAGQEVLASRAAYLPDLSLNFTYGIDAPQYALNGVSGVHNLGYATFATVDLPVWDWLATHHRVQQSEIRRDNATLALTWTQKRLVTQLREFYNEAATAHAALASLQTSVTDASESLRLTRLRYTAGEATVLEVVDAQNTRITLEIQLADATTRYRVALADLQTLTGAI